MPPLLVLLTILGSAFLVKWPALTRPLTGHFGSYQAVLAMMAERMDWKSAQSFFLPQTFMILDGKPAIELLYYPFASLFASALRSVAGGEMAFWGRFQAAVLVSAAGFNVYLLVKKFLKEETALLSAFLFSFAPMTLISGTSFQNEAAGIFFITASFLLAGNTGLWNALFSGLLFSFALVARIHFVFLFPALVLFFRRVPRKPGEWALFLMAGSAAVLGWYGFVYSMTRTHTNITTTLFGQAGEGRILFHPLLRTRAFYERIWEILMGPWITPVLAPFFVLAFFKRDSKILPFVFWVLGGLAPILILPQKFYDHPFYLIAAVPPACALAASALESLGERLPKKAWAALGVFFIAASLRFYVPPALFSQRDGKFIMETGRKVRKMTAENDKIIASYGTSCELLYYAHREGWTFDVQMTSQSLEKQKRHEKMLANGYGDPVKWLEYLRSQGAKYFVIADPATFKSRLFFYDYIEKKYPRAGDSDRFLIYNLSAPRS